MSSDSSNNPGGDVARQRRGSIGAGFTNMFRSNSISQGATAFPGPISTAMNNDKGRRLSISTLGLGNSPTASLNARRSSMSTNSDSIDENAIEEDDGSSRTAPATPFTRRMSFGAQAMRNMRGSGGSPNTSNGRPSPPLRRSSTAHGPPSPPTATARNGNPWSKITVQASTANSSRAGADAYPPSTRSDQGFNWSEQLRSRAESNVAAGPRPSFSFASGMGSSPPRGNVGGGRISPGHDRAKSVSEMPAPPAQAPRPRPQKPDHMQERILKGDFYMD
ncbi:hypothetical protein GQ53DRAFT_139398 [Thozetella sp. PMI_491]|nr:hypothetical protein GQ53DRAFT_139398 [Thozetella sp. PMI_491]